ncbi:phage antirepressor KilAC domain-containing protein [Virgibacillus halodenitrificans]|uniref:Phage regulatory protein/antirepressor Ant n=1 Tax=Virgibacillus halodenitrificans TaxID=1482 RepID=A0ABR7VNN5_VIRHA|nr:phage regulatory protein/antirepressor Ant [Virgibacillus halodenitrificans]MBD1223253.1 phage regulatory protein/antirepressor Ant [Virgibacillus halodenitrificans]
MNQLMNNDIEMTSLDIAEIIGKKHQHVMRDIRNEINTLGNEIGQSIFGQSSYLNKQNKKQPCYSFGKDGAMQLALKYDAKTRYKVIKRIEELENGQKLNLPGNYKEALIQLVGQVEENEKLEAHNKMLEQQVSEYEPKATYVDEILRSKDTVTISQVAEDYGMTGQEMNKLLHEIGIQYKLGGQWLLYSKHKGQGYTKSNTVDITHKSGRKSVSMHTKWTQKGRLFIYENLKDEGILPLMDIQLNKSNELVGVDQ